MGQITSPEHLDHLYVAVYDIICCAECLQYGSNLWVLKNRQTGRVRVLICALDDGRSTK